MKQEKGRTFNNILKGVNNSTRSKFKPTTINTPIKNAPLTAKVNSTWNNVLNRNKDSAKKASIPSKFDTNLAQNDMTRTLSYFINELKNKMDILLPDNRAVKNIMENILKTFSKMGQPCKIQKSIDDPKPVNDQTSNRQLTPDNKKITNADELVQDNAQLNANLKESLEQENLKLKKENADLESQLLAVKTELNASKQRVEKLESTLNESVNTERETIANYEQQCKRLQNEIKTLQDSSGKERSESSVVSEKQRMNRQIDINKFKYQMQMTFKELEMEKLLTILKYDETQINASQSEFRDVYELIQKYFTSDQNQQIQITFDSRSDKKI